MTPHTSSIPVAHATQANNKARPSLKVIIWYNRLAGLCDVLTGLLLIALPTTTLGLLGISKGPYPPAMVSFIGVFVSGVGLAYLLTSRFPRRPYHLVRLDTAWLITAVIRACVASYLTWSVVTGRFEPAWLSVAASDALLAAIQLYGRSQHWLSPDQLR